MADYAVINPATGQTVREYPTITDDELRAWVLDGRIFSRIQRYQIARLITERLSTSGHVCSGVTSFMTR